ncbi:MAG: helix-hairpin-helix domain-containing protein, partial [Lentisphaeria bacterium]|nr:helix-hairpin-helix domain-containing protein [Lentisphaeria bacterium]
LKTLGKINGVGKKTAERMVVELRDKVGRFSSAGSTIPAESSLSKEAGDAVAALETLGYKRDAAIKVVQKLRSDAPDGASPSASELIRKALSLLNS